jgi:Lrp/AsnC family leucine-responsive transcriptional regulator
VPPAVRAWSRFPPNDLAPGLFVAARDIAAFDALMSGLMAANPNVRRFTTNVVMSTVKRGLFVPID